MERSTISSRASPSGYTAMHVQGVTDWTDYAAQRGSGAQVSTEEVKLPILITWSLPVRKSRILLEKEVFKSQLCFRYPGGRGRDEVSEQN